MMFKLSSRLQSHNRTLSFGWQRLRHASSSSSGGEGERTALYDFHVRKSGKIVNFGGYALPVQYADQSIIASHNYTRRVGSIFDVSHMLQTYVRGSDAAACLESISTADILGMLPGAGSLTVFTNEQGGILDDLIVNKVSDKELYVVSNAAMKQQDADIMSSAVSFFKSQGKDVSIEFLSPVDQSLIAVQGPQVAQELAKLLSQPKSLDQLYFMRSGIFELAGIKNVRITRCGYTGEDGFEISVPSTKVESLTEALLAAGQLKLAGLGARDSLRLEAGLCLYGSDIDAKTTPVEAALAWLVAKRRRSTGDFPGAQLILQQLKEGVQRRRIGLQMLGAKPPPARAGVTIYSGGKQVGQLTSGCPSPTTGRNIAMGYVAEQLKAPGTQLELKVRDKFYEAEVTKMPFVKANYYTKPKQ
ncbi:aminomethyltransferase, mitochondrial [Drosophila grimshawi]|uniref:Aminomethyltransferase n=1 Tax=Drosophila grimshawi TaxID=7222 RepID=B4JE65_DROGR|nr:aminomethyltransferase, mitochondrial [Drosophila grimshawi]EDW03585.1 GH10422 [Drosophila grimshawi]